MGVFIGTRTTRTAMAANTAVITAVIIIRVNGKGACLLRTEGTEASK